MQKGLSKKCIEVFISYSHKDERMRDEIVNHLANLKRQGAITAWHDRKIGAGNEWAGEISRHLDTAKVILLLISSNFMSSDYCNDVEVNRAMERHEAGEARVIPVILRPVDWAATPFSKLQALPKDAKPVSDWTSRDKAYLDVVKGIRNAIESMGRSGILSTMTHVTQSDSSTHVVDKPEVSEVCHRLGSIKRSLGKAVGIIHGNLRGGALAASLTAELRQFSLEDLIARGWSERVLANVAPHLEVLESSFGEDYRREEVIARGCKACDALLLELGIES